MLHRFEIGLKPDLEDPEGDKILRLFHHAGWKQLQNVRTLQVYTLESAQIKSRSQLNKLVVDLFLDPVINIHSTDGFLGDQIEFDWMVEIGFRPGVTDNAAHVAQENLELLLSQKFDSEQRVSSSKSYFMRGTFSPEEFNKAVENLMVNNLIQNKTIIQKPDWEQQKTKLLQISVPKVENKIEVLTLDCQTQAKTIDHSNKRLLALSEAEAEAISLYFQQDKIQQQRKKLGLPIQPTDVELEAIAQTWSEHCKHKIFNATVTYRDENNEEEVITSLYKTFIQNSTKEIRKRLGEKDWCLSVFKDNAGIIKFNEDFSIAFKVETHNSPSALDPYGGALTGIVGVNRDSFGTGMGAQLVCNTDVFCFGPPDYNKSLPKKLFHPSRIYEGVRQGVEHGGNHSGIPTVNGAIVFDECFIGKPLVFCGTVSVMPSLHQGLPSEDKKASPGDRIVMVGGRIGKDGIHGATFSSLALDDNSPVSAVQIGDPITQKRMFDFLWEAKKEGLYSCITDNGAGGLSSSVGEMAEYSNGCKLFLDKAPLKYAGLQPWEILVSEAQERMTVSVHPQHLDRFMELSSMMHVESTDLGEFTDSGLFECFYNNEPVASLDLEFFHSGLPEMKLAARWKEVEQCNVDYDQPADLGEILLEILSRPNVCSKESVIRQYDHEVQGGSVIKPLVGINHDGPGDAGVVRPILSSTEGIVVGNGICPKYSAIDPYHMAACAIDEAIRNVIAVGGSLEQIAGLDNFCWPDPVESAGTPDGAYKMAGLVRACKAIYEYCIGFGVPCISGKDSMKNDAVLDGKKISILPTLLFSTIGKIADVRKCVTSDVKEVGDLVYILGDTFDECGASEYYQHLGLSGGPVPKVDWKRAKNLYNRVTKATHLGLIRSNHDCSDGGLAVALAEMAIGGELGLDIDIAVANSKQVPDDQFLFSETQSRFVVTIDPGDKESFELIMKEIPFYQIGKVTKQLTVRMINGEQSLLKVSVDQLRQHWKETLGSFDD